MRGVGVDLVEAVRGRLEEHHGADERGRGVGCKLRQFGVDVGNRLALEVQGLDRGVVAVGDLEHRVHEGVHEDRACQALRKRPVDVPVRIDLAGVEQRFASDSKRI